MSFVIPNDTKVDIIDGTIDLDGDVLRVLLHKTSGLTLDIDNDHFLSDVAFTELADASYARQTVSGVAASVDDTDDEAVLDGTDVTFSSLAGGESIEGAILYRQVGGDDTTPGNDEVIGHIITSEMPLTTNGSDVVLQWNSEGILNLA